MLSCGCWMNNRREATSSILESIELEASKYPPNPTYQKEKLSTASAIRQAEPPNRASRRLLAPTSSPPTPNSWTDSNRQNAKPRGTRRGLLLTSWPPACSLRSHRCSLLPPPHGRRAPRSAVSRRSIDQTKSRRLV